MQVALDVSEQRERLRNLTIFLGGAGAAGVLLGILAASLLSLRLVRPLRRMSAAAAALSPEDPARLERSGVREIDGLARTVNDAFERLAAALARERRFVADASHELRTPVATLLANAEIGLRRMGKGSAGARTLTSQVEVARRLSRLFEDLLVLARSDAGPAAQGMEPVHLHDVIASAVASVAERLDGRRMRVRVEPEEDPGCLVLGVREDLVRVVQNLLSNAIRYGPSDSTVRIRLECGKGRVRMSVSDEGPGIAAGDLPHVFERFYRADPARSGAEGSGLGLAIVQSIVHAHGGAVAVESSPGRGTTFRVELSLHPAEPEISRPAEN